MLAKDQQSGLIIFAGAYGSGKSEIALNYALQRVMAEPGLMLADLDMVNPYFASRDVQELLAASGIRLLAPRPDLSFGDVPSLPTEILGLIKDGAHMIIDVAGDEFGALVLGYLSRYIIARQDYSFYLVINPYRPFTENLADVVETRALIEQAARIPYTGIISNPNLLEETDQAIILAGHRQVCEYAAELELPVSALAVNAPFYEQLISCELEVPLLQLELYLRPGWLRG